MSLPARINPKERVVGWVGLRDGLNILEKRKICCPCRELSYDIFIVQSALVVYQLRYVIQTNLKFSVYAPPGSWLLPQYDNCMILGSSRWNFETGCLRGAATAGGKHPAGCPSGNTCDMHREVPNLNPQEVQSDSELLSGFSGRF